MGIGDVTRPLAPSVIDALHKAVDEQASFDTFCGYGPEQGYRFLTEAIAINDYQSRGIDISPEEIFISDGAKSDTGNIGDILSLSNKVALTDPVYSRISGHEYNVRKSFRQQHRTLAMHH